MNQSEYMTVTEARDYLGVSKVKIAQLIADGILPSVENKLDKRSRLITRVDLEALKRQGRPEGERIARKNAA